MKKSLVFTLIGLAIIIIAGLGISYKAGCTTLIVVGAIVAIFSFIKYAMIDSLEN